jgi:hypothetical protein
MQLPFSSIDAGEGTEKRQVERKALPYSVLPRSASTGFAVLYHMMRLAYCPYSSIQQE